jgi:membrane associated rhomboid family serine protease
MVMPLRDVQERHTFPMVNVALIAINIAVFFYQMSLGTRLEGFIRSAAFVPADYFSPGNALADARSVFVSMFLHGGWMHLGGNMLYLYIFGDNVEDRLGHGRYLLFYLACGWAATLLHGVLNAGSTVPAIGASGAISGVLGAYMLLFPKARVLTIIPIGFYVQMRELPALVVLGLWFVMQFLSGVVSIGVRSGHAAGVAWWAHIGGFVAGMILVKLLARPQRVPRSSWRL